jgi:hypothetical protein
MCLIKWKIAYYEAHFKLDNSFWFLSVVMGITDGEMLAFLHFTVTEMRPIWLLWYTVYNTFESIVTGASISDAFGNGYVTKCLYETKINVKGIEDCAKSAYKRYLASGPQKPYSECSEMCPGSGVGIDVPEPRSMFFFMTVWLFGMYISLDCLSVQLRQFSVKGRGGAVAPRPRSIEISATVSVFNA